MDKFKGKYRIPSTRWTAWDYAANAAYFITICTANRGHYFGRVINGAMTFSLLGQAAMDCWREIPAHFRFVVLDEFVVMPNHVHGIVVIAQPSVVDNTAEAAASPSQSKNRFGPQSKNLASIVRGYKIGVTKFARGHDIAFEWQARFHDHVIRNDDEYNRIRNYIRENPKKWTDDTYFTAT